MSWVRALQIAYDIAMTFPSCLSNAQNMTKVKTITKSVPTRIPTCLKKDSKNMKLLCMKIMKFSSKPPLSK